MAMARFLVWLFSCWHFTTMPVGLWVRRTAESVVLTLWPPAPVERITSHLEVGRVDLDVDVLGLGHAPPR